ncbi:CPBP family intramembrane glutamic endopeptidase [Ectobacillus ponti]|uniref:CPBP family intramembrane metalloprotease n=1 Tax=Ectobacillus ponti TaxID=2961894 RepID=A0AA42BQ28_9BACI|nr:CPBP family intramembrane glutamic endopeptidase [Ectobacillus ponti]MCP8969865.1 CPBP family intramembrane metalloprotease [Ectobacillus ponti]
MKHLKTALLLAGISFVGFIAAIPYLQATLGAVLQGANIPIPAAIAASVVQGTVMAFAAAWIGLKLGERVGLGAPIVRRWVHREGDAAFKRKDVLLAVLGGAVATGFVIALELLVFMPQLPVLSQKQPEVSWLAGMLTFIQGGVYEEILLRLLLMTLIVWLLQRLFARGGSAQPWMYITGIVLAAVLFGLGHLPATEQVFGSLTALLVVRAIVMNGVLGLFCGWLYWRKGLEYAMIAHAVGDILLHGVFS